MSEANREFAFMEKMDNESRVMLLLEQMVYELRDIKRVLLRRSQHRGPMSSAKIQADVEAIKQVCAAYYGTSVAHIDAHTRVDRDVKARFMAVFFAKDLLPVSLRELDRLFCRGNHFVENALRSLGERWATDPKARTDRRKLEKQLDRLWFGDAGEQMLATRVNAIQRQVDVRAYVAKAKQKRAA